MFLDLLAGVFLGHATKSGVVVLGVSGEDIVEGGAKLVLDADGRERKGGSDAN